MKSYLVVLVVAAALALVPVPSAGAIGDRGCSDFPTQAAAQKFYKKNGGPAKDPHRLDADRDGIACEDNP